MHQQPVEKLSTEDIMGNANKQLHSPERQSPEKDTDTKSKL